MRHCFVAAGSLIAIVSCAVFMSCGVNTSTLGDADKRIKVLQQKGVPDSSLSRAIVFLYQARDAKQRSNMGLARKSADSLLILVAKAEEDYEKDMARLKPYLEGMKAKFSKSRTELQGLPAARLDSMVALIDSFIAINWLLQAEAKAQTLDSLLPRLKFDQQRANELRNRVVGKWICTNITKHSEDKSVHAVEEKVFSFSKDGKAELIERKKGKSGPFLKEDWEFLSWGRYDLMGDTIFLFINRFKSARQMFEERHLKNGKDWWEKKPGPTYDSTITDGSQNRFITFEDLKADFSKK